MFDPDLMLSTKPTLDHRAPRPRAAAISAPYTHLLPANQLRDVTPARGWPVYSNAHIPSFSFCFSAARQPHLLQMFLHSGKGRLFYCELLRSRAAEKQKGSFRSFGLCETGHPLDCSSQKMRVSCRGNGRTPSRVVRKFFADCHEILDAFSLRFIASLRFNLAVRIWLRLLCSAESVAA